MITEEYAREDPPPKPEAERQSKPMAITTGPSQAEGIAEFAVRVTSEDLAPERRERLKVSVLDSFACAISALGTTPQTVRMRPVDAG